jgi:hypothetical protein
MRVRNISKEGDMSDNIFLVLGIQSREDCISNALAYAFNASSGFRRYFMEKICEKSLDRYDSAQAYTRVSTGTPGIPDLVLALENASCAEIVVIENKLKAEEGNDQTQRYMSTEAVTAIANRLLPGKPIRDPSFVFLTLFPDQEPAAGNHYILKRHSDLRNVAASITNWESALAEQLIKSWLSLTDKFYGRERVAPDDRFFEKLADDSGLDGGYLYFRSALTQVMLPKGLALEEFFRSSAQGRRYYGAIISKQVWHPHEMTEFSGSWLLDPLQDYNIHFEPQYNVLSGLFNCFLHYEVNPYETEAWVRANVPKDQYDAYLARRTAFSEKLQTKGLLRWSFGGGSNQLAKTTFDFSKSSYAHVKSTLEEALIVASQDIDSVLQKME